MKTTAVSTSFPLAIASLLGLSACTTYVQERPTSHVVYTEPAPLPPAPPPAPVVVQPPPPASEVVIQAESDFYEPLAPYGRWEIVDRYGRCWIPANLGADWRPYATGHWERTDAGWYWVSDEPWGWATYHYGRWDFDAHVGWFWVPQTMWAPAWVAWYHSDGYVGWSPLPPSARIAAGGVIELDRRMIHPGAYVFVEERHFLEPVRPRLIVKNTVVINRAVNIGTVRIANHVVISQGPRAEEIERVSGHRVQPLPARDLRHKIEAPIAAAHRPPARNAEVRRAPGPSQQQQRQGQAAAERARAESERKAKEAAQQRAQAEQHARDEARKAQAAAAHGQAVDARAQEQAQRAARQNQAQVEENRRQQELQHQRQTQAATAALKAQQQKQAEAQRHAQPQQKGKNKKPANPKAAGTNAPPQQPR